MPFQECSLMDQREEFCRLALSEGANIRALCRRFGIGSATGYKWLRRFRTEGPAGLAERSRRPHRSPRQSPAALEEQVLALRRQHPVWGGRKLRRLLQQDGCPDGLAAPSASTISAMLRRHGLLDGPRAGAPRGHIRFEHAAPNLLWQMDFKGHFALASGRCHPLTVLDDHSRYALAVEACADQRAETVQARLARLFARHGLPWRMLADNGSPWGSAGGDHYTALGVWLLDLDIALVHGRPCHPQTQGKQERLHRTLVAELLDGRCFRDLAAAQAGFDAFRATYNLRRPHQALDMQTPASRYRPSPRALPAVIAPPDYEAGVPVRRVDQGGWISFQNHRGYCGKAFAGRPVALRHTDTDGLFNLCYRSHVIAQLNRRHSIP
jgi:transposase InsO family protein